MTLTPERPRLVLPGLLPADPALERYRIHPGAVTAVELEPGDVLTVVDVEGRQRGELTVLAGGGEDYGALGVTADTVATVLRYYRFADRWSSRGLDPRPGAGRGAVRRVVAAGRAGGVHGPARV